MPRSRHATPRQRILRQLSRRHHFSNDIPARENDHREVETPASLRTLTPCYTAPRGRRAKHARKNQKYIVDHRGIVDEPSRHISDAEAHQLRIRRCTRAKCRHVGCRRNATDGQKMRKSIDFDFLIRLVDDRGGVKME